MCERVQSINCVIVFDTWCYPRFYKLAKISRLIYLIHTIARAIFKFSNNLQIHAGMS